MLVWHLILVKTGFLEFAGLVYIEKLVHSRSIGLSNHVIITVGEISLHYASSIS